MIFKYIEGKEWMMLKFYRLLVQKLPTHVLPNTCSKGRWNISVIESIYNLVKSRDNSNFSFSFSVYLFLTHHIFVHSVQNNACTNEYSTNINKCWMNKYTNLISRRSSRPFPHFPTFTPKRACSGGKDILGHRGWIWVWQELKFGLLGNWVI